MSERNLFEWFSRNTLVVASNLKGLEYRSCSIHKAGSLSIPSQVLEASRNTTELLGFCLLWNPQKWILILEKGCHIDRID